MQLIRCFCKLGGLFYGCPWSTITWGLQWGPTPAIVGTPKSPLGWAVNLQSRISLLLLGPSGIQAGGVMKCSRRRLPMRWTRRNTQTSPWQSCLWSLGEKMSWDPQTPQCSMHMMIRGTGAPICPPLLQYRGCSLLGVPSFPFLLPVPLQRVSFLAFQTASRGLWIFHTKSGTSALPDRQSACIICNYGQCNSPTFKTHGL